MPSRTDSFGIVFLEAWANAKPVVAAAAGGVCEVIEQAGPACSCRSAMSPTWLPLDTLLAEPTLARRWAKPDTTS